MPETQPKFVWYDLMTSDIPSAATFYGKVIGWSAKESGVPGAAYSVFSMGSRMVAGLMDLPEPSFRPSWMGYVGVDDVDASTARLTAAGGAVYVPPRDIPYVGRFSLVADPQGAVFYLFRPLGSESPEPPAPGTPGLICWHELAAADLETAYAFYAEQFGWTRAGAHDMGSMGQYLMFSTGDPMPAGGILTTPPGAPGPFWLYYLSVDGIQAAAERVTAAGGKVVQGPTEVPGGWVAQCLDPQGALFGMASMQS